MMSLEVFNYESSNVRAFELDGQAWFVAKDVCDVLELSNPTVALERLDEDERSKFNLGRQGEVNVVNEYGLYNLVLGSRKREAKKFQRWVRHEVLPSIRKTGQYSTHQPVSIEDLIIMQAKSVKELKEQVANQQQALEMVSHRVDTLDLTNIEGDARQRLSAMIRKYAFTQGINFSIAWKHFDQSFNFAYRRNIGLMITHHASRMGKPSNKVTRPEVLEAYGMLEDALRVADKMLNRAS